MAKKYKSKEIRLSVGIHTGDVDSGIMGKSQWHFDVIGLDVDIAREIQKEAPPG